MKVLYTRVSTLDQKTDRQKVNEKDFSLVVEDKCSGSIPFFERQGGVEIKKLIEMGALTSLSALSIDRLGRDMLDIMNTIHFFTDNNICIHFISQGLSTLDENGKENSISKMIINILGVVSEMGRAQILENQRSGINLAKLRNVYKGRVTGSSEDVLKFLSKKKNKQALELLKKGVKGVQVAKATGVHINTITKIKKLGLPNQLVSS